MSMNSLIY